MPHIPLVLIGISAVVKVVTTTVVWKKYRKRKLAKQEAARARDQQH
jgi:hypothetical protein